jgi:hypothetical protein
MNSVVPLADILGRGSSEHFNAGKGRFALLSMKPGCSSRTDQRLGSGI